MTPSAMTWRKPGQGFYFGFVGIGSHKGTGDNVAHFIAAISNGKGEIAVEQYYGSISGKRFSSNF